MLAYASVGPVTSPTPAAGVVFEPHEFLFEGKECKRDFEGVTSTWQARVACASADRAWAVQYGGLGYTARGVQPSDSLFVCDVEANRWSRVQRPGAPLVWPPALHSASLVSAYGSIWLFGGAFNILHPGISNQKRNNELWRLDIGSWHWSRVSVEGPAPEGRSRTLVLFDQTRGRLVVFGGNGTSAHRSDLWFFSFSDRKWTEVEYSATAPWPSVAL
eukprot:tig00000310_g24006.t1